MFLTVYSMWPNILTSDEYKTTKSGQVVTVLSDIKQYTWYDTYKILRGISITFNANATGEMPVKFFNHGGTQ